jgi:hypothetical protein
LDEGTSYAIDFKAKFDCMGASMTQTSATVQYYALANRPNVTLAGKKKASPVVSQSTPHAEIHQRFIIHYIF